MSLGSGCQDEKRHRKSVYLLPGKGRFERFPRVRERLLGAMPERHPYGTTDEIVDRAFPHAEAGLINTAQTARGSGAAGEYLLAQNNSSRNFVAFRCR